MAKARASAARPRNPAKRSPAAKSPAKRAAPRAAAKSATKRAAPPAAAKSPAKRAAPRAAAKSPAQRAAAKSATKRAAPRAAAKSPAKRAAPRSAPQARYPFVAVDVREAYAAEIAALLFASGASGVEERDDITLRKGPGHGSVTVVGTFPTHSAARAAIKAVRASRPILRPRLEEVVGDAWRDAWKEHFSPFALTPRLIVAPPWSVPAAAPGSRVLVLEPGRAFGTGLHASTALIASLMDERAKSFAGKAILDVGTGSGILALAALALGAARAVALDTDPEAILVARENAQRNGLAARFEARVGSAGDSAAQFALVLANIETRTLEPMASELKSNLGPGGTLLLSGVLAGESRALTRRYESLGLRCTATATRGEAAGEAWVALAFQAAR